MEYSGLLFKYKLNRPLSSEERDKQLHFKLRASKAPDAEKTIIRRNATFIEVVDKYYAHKGFAAAFVMPICLVILGVIGYFDFDFLVNELNAEDVVEGSIAMILINLMLLSLVAFGTYCLLKTDIATYTHLPVRLNRKTRMVHVFRHNGPDGVLSVKWDDLFICAAPGKSNFYESSNWDIRCHVLDKKGWVKDTFSFGAYQLFAGYLPHHWEYFRRYMEEDPATLPNSKEYLPIANQRESFWFGVRQTLQVMTDQYFIWLLLSPLTALPALFRYIAMRTSKVPQWPAEIEVACQVEEGGEFPADDVTGTPTWQIAIGLILGLTVDVYLVWLFLAHDDKLPHPHTFILGLFS